MPSKGLPCPYALCDKHYRRKELLAYHIKNDHGNVWPEEESVGGERQGGGGGGGGGGASGGGGALLPGKAKEGAPTKEEIMGKEKVLPKTSAPEDNVAKEKRSVAPTLKERIAALQASSAGGVFSEEKKVVKQYKDIFWNWTINRSTYLPILTHRV